MKCELLLPIINRCNDVNENYVLNNNISASIITFIYSVAFMCQSIIVFFSPFINLIICRLSLMQCLIVALYALKQQNKNKLMPLSASPSTCSHSSCFNLSCSVLFYDR